MKLHSILGNSLHLDGGAMYGHVPKSLWERWTPPDASNRIHLASRVVFLSTAHHRVLFEAGTGAYMEPKYRDRYGINESNHVLLDSLGRIGVCQEDVTDIILSHLHFDHAGGLLCAWQEGKKPSLLFPNAAVHVSSQAWDRALRPHQRDKASFAPELNQLLERSGRVSRLEGNDILSFDELEVRFFASNGHTLGMLCSDVRWNGNRLVFGADLIAGRNWVHVPVCMGYDRFPELVAEEKEELLSSLVAQQGWLFYAHDPQIAVSRVKYDGKRQRFETICCRADLECFSTE